MFQKDFYNLRAVRIVIGDRNPSFSLVAESETGSRRITARGAAEENLLPSIFASSINAHWLRNVTR
jgi:hypothetical protein